MGGRKWLVLALLIAAGPAWGQSDADYDNYTKPVVDSFNECARPKVRDLAKGDETPAAIAEAVIKTCHRDVDRMREVLLKPPFSHTEAEADQAISQWLDQARTDFTESVEKLRS